MTIKAGDQIYVASPPRRESWVWEHNNPTTTDEHAVWHRSAERGMQERLKPGVDYRRVRINKEGIEIETFVSRYTIPHGEYAPGSGMSTGRVSSIEPLVKPATTAPTP
jgi:hypothetical protein